MNECYIQELSKSVPYEEMEAHEIVDTVSRGLMVGTGHKLTGIPMWVHDEIEKDGLLFVTCAVGPFKMKAYSTLGTLIEADIHVRPYIRSAGGRKL